MSFKIMSYLQKIIICLIFLGIVTSCNDTSKIGKLEVIQNVDLDTLQSGASKEIELFVYNKGNGNLEIQNIESDCHCTLGKVKDTLIVANDSTSFSVKVTPKDTGVFKQKIIIRSNTPDIFSIIEVKAYVVN